MDEDEPTGTKEFLVSPRKNRGRRGSVIKRGGNDESLGLGIETREDGRTYINKISDGSAASKAGLE